MAIQATTNLHGNVATDGTVATIVTLPTHSQIVEVNITGTGAARMIKNGTSSSPTTDIVNDGGSGYRPLIAEPGSGGIATIGLYSNASESSLTYSINVPLVGKVTGA